MIKILFVCHGNICRSPMAEFVLKDMVEKQNIQHTFYIYSAATSREEIGNGIHRGTKKKLKETGIPCSEHKAIQLTLADYEQYDYLLGMDSVNIRNMKIICNGDSNNKIYRLLDFSSNPRDIADPWYSGNFDLTYNDIKEGCESFLDFIQNKSRKS